MVPFSGHTIFYYLLFSPFPLPFPISLYPYISLPSLSYLLSAAQGKEPHCESKTDRTGILHLGPHSGVGVGPNGHGRRLTGFFPLAALWDRVIPGAAGRIRISSSNSNPSSSLFFSSLFSQRRTRIRRMMSLRANPIF